MMRVRSSSSASLLVGQAEDEVRAHGDAACGRRLDGASCRGEVVAPGRSCAAWRRRSIRCRTRRRRRCGGRGRPDSPAWPHPRSRDGCPRRSLATPGRRAPPEEPLEPFERRIGIAVRLEVDQESRSGRKPAPVEGDRVVDLLPDGAARVAVGGREGLVRAERTAAVSYRAVAVGGR